MYMVFVVTVSSYPSIDHVLTSGRISSVKGSSALGTVFLKMSSMQLRSTHSRTVSMPTRRPLDMDNKGSAY